MAEVSFWLDLFTPETWREAREADFAVSGFRQSRWATVQRIRPGDILLCYLIRASRWVGALEVVSEAFRDDSPLWRSDVFPCRLGVRPIVTLKPENGVPIRDMAGQLSFFRRGTSSRSWTGYLRGSPARMKSEDGQAVLAVLREAERHPQYRPLDPRLIRLAEERPARRVKPDVPRPQGSEHNRIQWLLLKLGSDMSLDVWVARNDRGRSWRGNRFADIPRIRAALPQQFDQQTNRVIEMIDVLWLEGNAIQCAFEVEHTTSIYSGILRMSDLVALQPNLDIKLYLVAPDERRHRVFEELNRPTFTTGRRALPKLCRFLPFSKLTEAVERHGLAVRYMKPDFIDSIAELFESAED